MRADARCHQRAQPPVIAGRIDRQVPGLKSESGQDLLYRPASVETEPLALDQLILRLARSAKGEPNPKWRRFEHRVLDREDRRDLILEALNCRGKWVLVGSVLYLRGKRHHR